MLTMSGHPTPGIGACWRQVSVSTSGQRAPGPLTRRIIGVQIIAQSVNRWDGRGAGCGAGLGGFGAGWLERTGFDMGLSFL